LETAKEIWRKGNEKGISMIRQSFLLTFDTVKKNKIDKEQAA